MFICVFLIWRLGFISFEILGLSNTFEEFHKILLILAYSNVMMADAQIGKIAISDQLFDLCNH